MELKRLEVEIAKEMKKPNEDMCLADHKVITSITEETNNSKQKKTQAY